MASGSFPTLVDIASLFVVDIKDPPCPILNNCPQIAKVNDSINAFSRVPDGVTYVIDVQSYIYYTLEDFGSSEIKNVHDCFVGEG